MRLLGFVVNESFPKRYAGLMVKCVERAQVEWCSYKASDQSDAALYVTRDRFMDWCRDEVAAKTAIWPIIPADWVPPVA